MNKFNPKVSIVIPVFNGSNYLRLAIDSALAQTYRNIEIIVVNDGSDDNGATENVAKSYGNKIRYYKKQNGGVATALNYGIRKMTGDYFSWLSHDDTYKKTKIQKQIEYLTKLKDRNVVLFSNYSVMNEDGAHQYNCILNHEMLEKKPCYALIRGNINGITILVPKKAFNDYGDFDISLRCTQDYDMWYRMQETYKFIHMKSILSTTRVHSLQDTKSNPLVISEGNKLWVRMIEGISDEQKRAVEGTVYKFYFEMVKFLRQTPYDGALSHCTQLLESAVQAGEAVQEGFSNPKLVSTVFNELVKEDQRKAGSNYISSIVKHLVRANDTYKASSVLLTNLNGKGCGLGVDEIEKQYVAKIPNVSNKPRVMFTSGHWLTGGMERVMSVLFDQLKEDYELFLLTAYDGQGSKIKVPSYVTHIKISNKIFYSSFDTTALSYAQILDINLTIGFMNLFDGQLKFYELCRGTVIKTIASNHETYFYPYSRPNLYDLVKRRLDAYRTVDAVLWLTNTSAATYGLASNNSYLMPNPNLYKVWGEPKKNTQKVILCVGRFNDDIKRVDRMLQTFSLVLKKHPDAKLVLVGKYDMNSPIRPDDERTLAEYIKELSLDKSKFDFVGEVENIEDYYKSATVLLLTSMNEGFGLVINEAACFGVPTVYNRIPGLEDLITDGENGLVVEQDDIDAMANAVDKILSDNVLRKRLSENSMKLVQRFDASEIGTKWKILLSTILKDENPHRMLNKYLDFTVDDYEELSCTIFAELNKAVEISDHERERLLNPKYESTASIISKRTKNKYARFNKSLKTNGILYTGKLIAKKTYHKTRRLTKQS